MRDHLRAGGDPDVDEDFTLGKGFPLGSWVADAVRAAAGELSADERAQIDELPGWRWSA